MLGTLLVLGAAIAISYPDLQVLLSVFGGLLLIFTWAFEHFEREFTNDAARMQEKLDTQLFGLRWNELLVGEQPTGEDESNAERKFRGNRSHLYPDLKRIPARYAQLLAQRSSAVWDFRQRRRYAVVVGLITLLTFSFGIWLGRNMTLSNYLLFIALPSTPAYLQGLEATLEQLQVSVRKQRLYENIERLISFDLTNARPLSDEDVRDAQDILFILRCRPGNVPQSLYRFLRPGYKKDMETATDEWKDKILRSKTLHTS